jgi:hypothetical protein
VREDDCGQRFVAIGNEDRSSDFSALFDHSKSLNGDAFDVANAEGATKLAWVESLSGTSREQAEDCDALGDHAAHLS